MTTTGTELGGSARLFAVGGSAAVVGAVLAVAGNAIVLAAHPNAPAGVVSYPLSARDFQLGQVFFAVTQAFIAIGIFALARSGAAGRGRLARAGGFLALVGFVGMVPGELVLAFVADAATDSARASAASSVFGIGVLVADVGLILFGIAALRTGFWPKIWGAMPIVLGAFQLLAVTPVAFTFGFSSLPAFVVITIQDSLIALLGVLMVRRAQEVSPRQPES